MDLKTNLIHICLLQPTLFQFTKKLFINFKDILYICSMILPLDYQKFGSTLDRSDTALIRNIGTNKTLHILICEIYIV